MGISEDYLPAFAPAQTSPEMRRFLDEELKRIAERINLTFLQLPILGEEPDKRENGVIIYADGTSWNPGSGEGFYGYENGAWVKL